MSISTPELPDYLVPTITYTVQGTENVFSYSFYVVDSDDMYVYLNGVVISSSNYTVTGIGDESGGFVTIDTNLEQLVVGDAVTISRFTLPEQLTVFLRTGDFTADSVNAEFNRIYALLQERDLAVSDTQDDIEDLNERVSINEMDISSNRSNISKNTLYIEEEKDARIAADASLQGQISGGSPLEASAFSPVSWHKQIIENSIAIPDNVNAWSFGPEVEIALGQEVEVGSGSFWTIANGVLVTN